MVLFLFPDWQYWMVLFLFYFSDWQYWMVLFLFFRLEVPDGIVFIFRLAVLDGIEPESVVVKFFGIFFFFFQCNSIVGHMISTGGTSNKIYLLKQYMNNMTIAFM